MKKIIKRTLERFLACVTVVTVVTTIIAGKTATEQIGKQTIGAAKYAMISVSNHSSRIELKTKGETFILDMDKLRSAVKLKEKFALTPLGGLINGIEELAQKDQK